MKKKIAYFLSHPIQYITPVLQALSKEVDLEVYYYSDLSIRGDGFDSGFNKVIKWDVPLLDGYEYKFLKNFSKTKSMGDVKFSAAINPGVLSILKSTKSDVIIVNSWTFASDILLILAAGFFGKKVWLHAENPLHKELKQSAFKRIVKKLFFKYFLFKFFTNKILYIGSENKKFFKYCGVDEKNLIFTPYCIDNKKFQMVSQQLADRRHEIKTQLNLPLDRKVILFCGKFMSIKRPLDLIQAFENLKSKNADLVLVGDGELKGEIENYIKRNSLDHVYLPGFVNQSEISKYYSIADVFVLCSEMETWGLSVNEALNFNVPCIVSDNSACGMDLIIEGVNGFIYETGNISELAKCLDLVLSEEKNISDYEFESINSFSIEVVVNNLVKSLN